MAKLPEQAPEGRSGGRLGRAWRARACSGAANPRARRSEPSAWARTPSPRCVGLPPRAPQPAKRRRRSPFSAPKWGAAAAACSQTARSPAVTLAARPDISDAEGMGTARTFSRARFARLESESRGARCTPRRCVWRPWRRRCVAERGVWWPRACACPLLTRWAPAGGVVSCVLASPGRRVCRCAARLTFACVLGRVFGLPEATEPPFRRSAFAHCSSDQGAIANPGCAAACVLYSCLCRLLLWLPRCGCAPGFSTICGWASTPGALSVICRSKAWCQCIS